MNVETKDLVLEDIQIVQEVMGDIYKVEVHEGVLHALAITVFELSADGKISSYLSRLHHLARIVDRHGLMMQVAVYTDYDTTDNRAGKPYLMIY